MMSKTLLALAFLMPLSACAAQPTAGGSADGSVVAQAPLQQDSAALPARPAPADAGRAATETATETATVSATPEAAPPSRTAPGGATGTPAGIPVAGRTTTVGEVPTTAGTPIPAPDAATMPAAPAAIPGTPATPAPIQVGQAAAAPSAGSLLQTILALALVLALLAALAWAMKRYGPRMSGNSANLRMVGALNIGGRERIMVVEVGDQWIVVGASPGRVNALATMPKGDATQSTATLAGHTPSAATFADWLKQTIDKRNAK